MNWKKTFNFWVENSPEEVKNKIEKYTEEEKELYFSSELKFGTAGLREKMGYGSSLINEFNIAKYSLALGKMFLEQYGDIAKKTGIIIAHDNRRNNILFSETAAEVISALGIPVYLFHKNELKPTPLLSYAVGNGNYIGGINITASHNPPDYNGYKVYNSKGMQMLPVETDKVIKYSKENINIFKIKRSKKLVNFLSPSIEKQYIQIILNLIPFKSISIKKDIKVIYTSQHGTAAPFAKKIMDKMGIDYNFVKEQLEPDPEFSNTVSPNPQDPDSFILAREYGDKYNSDVLFSTDPDADRFGIEIRHNNKWISVDGNQLPLIQIQYKLMMLKKENYIENGDFIVRSIVTSSAADKIAAEYNVETYKSLIGFKWLIHESFKHELQGNECLFAWEEAYGSSIRSFTRDKDSFQALVQVIEIIDYYKQKGKTLIDVLDDIYKKIGYYNSPQIQFKIEGTKAVDKMNLTLKRVKELIVGNLFNGYTITKIIDFSKGYKYLEKDNFVAIEFDNLHRVTIRPSGTEPILRVYFDIVDKNKKKSREITNDLIQKIETFINQKT